MYACLKKVTQNKSRKDWHASMQKKTAIELAGKYFKGKKLVEPYEHKKDEVYCLLCHA